MSAKIPRILVHGVILLFLAPGLTACGRSRSSEDPPTATTVVPTATATVESGPLASLAAVELLAQPGTQIACDHGPDADLTCTSGAGTQHIEAAITASTFARWSLTLPAHEMDLSGDETLVLRAKRSGEIRPNLYVVETDGSRRFVSLARFGLGDSWNDIHVPLREIVDEEGNRPDFAQINAIQIVFEWADMAGQLELSSLRFDPVWQETVAVPESAPGLTVPDGFAITPIAADLHNPTQIEVRGDGSLLISQQNGRVWWYRDEDGDGRYQERHLYTTGFTEVVGLLSDPTDGAVWIGGRGQLYRTLDSDGNGVADVRERRIDGLPWGRHQNNGLAWNPVADPFSGEPPYTWIYFGLGSTEDLAVGGEWNASILRFPRDGQGEADLQIVSQGNRNAYDLAWAAVPVDPQQTDGDVQWTLFASENGPDFNDAPDEVNHIRWGHHYGFPEQFGPVADGAVDGEPYSGPVTPLPAHASANGLAYVTNPAWPPDYRTLYVALFGEVFSSDVVGHTVDRIALQPVQVGGEETYRGQPSLFITGLDRPLALNTDSSGNLLVADYATGLIYQVSYRGQ